MVGKFIVLEGLDGAGKATQAEKLADRLPGACTLSYPEYELPVGQLIESFLHKDIRLPPESQFLLFASDMLKDRGKILRWLEAGRVVVCNRYIASALAYQSALGFSLETGREFVKLFGFPKPDLVFYLKISPETSMKRKQKQKGRLDNFESKQELLAKAAQQYQKLAAGNVLGKWVVINGEQEPEKVFEDIKSSL